MNKSKSFFSILIPSATVFFSSACIMVLELVAGRLIARYLGSSLYTWTSVIGVILAGIAIGNYLGGRIADRFQARKTLAVLFAVSSAACVVVVILNNLVGEWIWLWRLSWPLRVFTHVSLVFLLPSTLLGTISPVVAKMALERGLPTGRTVGDIYACGAAGSIAGTFVAGFYLIAAMGTVAIIWIIGGALLLLAILYWVRSWPLHLWMVVFLSALFLAWAPMQWCRTAGAALALREKPDPKVIYQDESQYCYIAVRQISENPDRRLFMQDKFRDSDIIMGDINDLQYFYTKIYACITRALGRNKDKLAIMVIGGGGYVFPRYVEQVWPGSRIDVVEIDPAVTKAAIEAFGLAGNSSINTFSMDGRNYVDQLVADELKGGPKVRYDIIYEDAFNDYSVPYQLVTKEFHDKISKILTDDGAYMINMIDVYDSGRFLGAIINTLQRTFPYVYVTTNYVTLSSVRETFIVTATKRPFDIKTVEDEKGLRLWRLNESEIEGLKKRSYGIVLTDDYAPVENLLAPVVRQSAREMLANKYLEQAETLKAAGKWERSIGMYEEALRLNPSMSIKAYNEIGMIQAGLGNLQGAAQAFQNAIDYHNRTGAKERVIGSVCFNLGILLGKMGRPQQAREELARAVQEFRLELAENPDSAMLWSRLGDTLATLGDFKAASDAFRKVVALEPANIAYYYNLAKVLEFQGRFSEAIDMLKKAIKLAAGTGQANAVAGLNEYLKSLEQSNSKQKQ